VRSFSHLRGDLVGSSGTGAREIRVGQSFSGCVPRFRAEHWSLAICAIKQAPQISLDFFPQMLYSTPGGF